jgi:hypothetical protein
MNMLHFAAGIGTCLDVYLDGCAWAADLQIYAINPGGTHCCHNATAMVTVFATHNK